MTESSNKPLAGRNVGFAGLGLMGRPMARNLAAAGAEMRVWNRSPGPRETLASEGMTAVETPAELLEGVDLVIMCVADTPAVVDVVTGAQGLLSALKPGTLIVDMGTTTVPETRRMAGLIRDAGGDYVDAPVSGGDIGATQGTLSIMAGGSDDAFARALPLFQAMGHNVSHVGDVGAGQVAKAANQVIVAVTISAVAEALALAQTAGVDPAKVRDALMGGFAQSRILELHGNRMVTGSYEPGGRSRLQVKDLVQIMELAGLYQLDLPTTKLVHDRFTKLVEMGRGELDHSALFTLFEQAGSVDQPK